MTVDRIKISREVCLGGKWIGLEASLKEGESIHDALTAIDKRISDYVLISSNGWGDGVIQEQPQPKVINRLYDDIRDKIKDCTSLEELAQFKEQCGKSPDLMPAYMDKLKSLTIEHQTNDEY